MAKDYNKLTNKIVSDIERVRNKCKNNTKLTIDDLRVLYMINIDDEEYSKLRYIIQDKTEYYDIMYELILNRNRIEDIKRLIKYYEGDTINIDTFYTRYTPIIFPSTYKGNINITCDDANMVTFPKKMIGNINIKSINKTNLNFVNFPMLLNGSITINNYQDIFEVNFPIFISGDFKIEADRIQKCKLPSVVIGDYIVNSRLENVNRPNYVMGKTYINENSTKYNNIK